MCLNAIFFGSKYRGMFKSGVPCMEMFDEAVTLLVANVNNLIKLV